MELLLGEEGKYRRCKADGLLRYLDRRQKKRWTDDRQFEEVEKNDV